MTLHTALSRNFDHSMLRDIIIVAASSLLLTLLAKVSIPFYPFVLGGFAKAALAAAVFPAAWGFLKARGLA